MSKFKGKLHEHVYSLPGNDKTCRGCRHWLGAGALYDCPKGGLVHRAQIMRCYEPKEVK